MSDMAAVEILELIRKLETSSPEQELCPNDGYIFTKDQNIYVIDAQAGGKQPTIFPNPEIQLYINGVAVTEPKVVYSSDRITWKLADEAQKPYEIQVSEDRMEVSLTVNPYGLSQRVLKTLGPVLHYTPQLESLPLEDVAVLSEVIVSEVKEMGVVAPIDMEAIQSALAEASGNPVVIARGTPPTPGQDGYVETFFQNTTEAVLTEWNGRVDYRERLQIPMVKQGEALGVIHKAEQGQPGRDVFGAEVPPPPAREVVVITRRNVAIHENGQAIALKAGRPSLTGEKIKYFEVQTVYIVNGDVDLSVGNVYFNGDIVIKGDVKETMRVETTGNIYVYGNAYNASLVSAQNIYIRGHATRCEIFAGKLGVLYSRIYNCFKKLTEIQEAIEREAVHVQQLMNSKTEYVPIGKIVALLVEMRYKGMLKQIEEFEMLLAKAGKMLPSEFTLAGRLLALYKNRDLMNTLTDYADFRRVHDYINDLKIRIESSVFEESDIVVGAANQSLLATNGSLFVTGQGLVNCDVEVNMDCVLKSKNASCRGGKVVAGRRIIVAEAGTPFARNTFLHAGESVRIGRANGVTIRVGDRLIEIFEEKENLCLWLDKDRNLHQVCIRDLFA